MPVKKNKTNALEELRNITNKTTQQALENKEESAKEVHTNELSLSLKKEIRHHLIQIKMNDSELNAMKKLANKKHIDNYAVLIRGLIKKALEE